MTSTDSDSTGTSFNDTRRGRRGFLASVGVAAGTLTVLTVGQSLGWLRHVDLFGARRSDDGPQRVAVNRTAAAAAVEQTAMDPGWRLTVAGPTRTLVFARDDLAALPQVESVLPISCVEGWSVQAHWTGVRVRDLLAAVGAPDDARARFTSLEPQGAYRVTEMGPEFARHPATLVALSLNGETLALDHGYPARLIAPDRPGVLQTKWLSRLEVV